MLISDLEFVEDAATGNTTMPEASERVTNLNARAGYAGMSVSKSKTKAQHIRHQSAVTATSESDIAKLPREKKFQFECVACGMTYPTKHGLSVHQGRWYKGRRTAKKLSRKGTARQCVFFVYLGVEVAEVGDQRVTEAEASHRVDTERPEQVLLQVSYQSTYASMLH